MLDTIFKVLKITVILLLSAIFLVAINNLTGFLFSTVSNTIVGEFFAIFSACMPFNAGTVFLAIFTVCGAILSFLIAKKIYDLSTWANSAV